MTQLALQISFSIAAAPARVYQALTTPAELTRWFAEHVVVEPRPGGAYRFWGRGVVDGSREGTQRLSALEPDRLLAYDWTLQGVATQVTYRLTAEGDKTKLDLEHTVDGELRFPKPKQALDDMWRMVAGNLMAHLGSETPVLADLDGREPRVVASIEIAASRAKVFRALLEPALLDKWLHGAARVDLAARTLSYGWAYEIDGRKVAGGPTKILELVENERLVTDWPDWRGDPDKPPQRITWTLEELGPQRTRVTLVHDGFEHGVDRSDYQQGWGGFLEGLADVASHL
jgi:uncharacterized protein YndB with AHSA1/START domain